VILQVPRKAFAAMTHSVSPTGPPLCEVELEHAVLLPLHPSRRAC
jgi:hypothetical protein